MSYQKLQQDFGNIIRRYRFIIENHQSLLRLYSSFPLYFQYIHMDYLIQSKSHPSLYFLKYQQYSFERLINANFQALELHIFFHLVHHLGKFLKQSICQ